MNWMELGIMAETSGSISCEAALAVLRSEDAEILEVLAAAFRPRRKRFGMDVALHVIRNARSGLCSEDCAFCSQSATASTPIERYPMQDVDELVAGARAARQMGALRYCMVASGRGPGADIETVCEAVRRIKAEVPIQVCTSLGSLDEEQALRLKSAGVDRYNHNLETAERFFPQVCSTHTYAGRVAAARAAKRAGLDLCCGGIIGMGESLEDRVDLAFAVRELGADSIPVNFFDPRPGTRFADRPRIGALDALRTLAMFRLVNPEREIRAAGGREACLGPLQPLALYAANSIFTSGYLTTGGQGCEADLAMIRAAGFRVGPITDAA